VIDVNKISYDYIVRDENDQIEDSVRAVDDVSLSITQGEFVCVLGHNGSGKSTLAKMLNAILLPTFGEVLVLGMNTKDETKTLEVRKNVGMVFQNPDNQIVSNVVEEDVAFGPENLGVPTEEIKIRVAEACEKVGIAEKRTMSPNRLSGGQKQRVAIAGVLAMKPKCIVLDEATAMLDPIGRKDVLSTLEQLNKEDGITIVLITHYMEEAIKAGRVIIMDGGKLIMEGTPKDVFSQPERIREYGLDVPQVTELADTLISKGVKLPKGILTVEELIRELKA